MINVLSMQDGCLREAENFCPSCWVNLIDPEDDEIRLVSQQFKVEEDMLRAALDEEESAHVDVEDNNLLVIVDIPIVQPDVDETFFYTTIPLGIIICPDAFITVCTRETTLIEDFLEGRVKQFTTAKKTRFLLQILYRNATKFLQYLKQIDKASSLVESELQRSMRNRELLQMMRLEKSLVYFSTSLTGNEAILEKLLKSPSLVRYPDDEDLLEDVIIENKQAIEMCTIYRDILSGTMDAYASVISNNLNIVMKFLASFTIVLTIPQLVFSLFGINTAVPWEGNIVGFWIVLGIGVVTSVVSIVILWRKKMF